MSYIHVHIYLDQIINSLSRKVHFPDELDGRGYKSMEKHVLRPQIPHAWPWHFLPKGFQGAELGKAYIWTIHISQTKTIYVELSVSDSIKTDNK